MSEDLFNRKQKQDQEKKARRRHLQKGSSLYFLKSVLYSKTRKIVERPRRTIPPKQQVVSSDWGQQEDDFKYEIAMKKNIQQKNLQALLNAKIAKIIMLAAVGFAVLSVFYAGFVLFMEQELVSADKIDIKVVAPKSVSSGDIFQMQLSIKNNNQKSLDLAELIIKYPKGARSPTDTKLDLTIQRLQLGKISPGQTKKGTVRAVLFAPKDKLEKIKIELEYRPEGESYRASVVSYHSVRINSDAVEVFVDIDKEAIQKQDVLATVSVASRAKVPIYNLVLFVQYPFGFKPKAYSEAPIESDNIWLIPQLDPGEQKQIKIKGKIIGQDLDEKTFVFKVGFKKDEESEEIALDPVIAEVSRTVKIKKPFISMEFELLDAKYDDENKFFAINSDQTYTGKIKWKNNLDSKLENVIFAVSIYGNAVDPFEVNPVAGFYDSKNNVMIWNKTTTKGKLSEVKAKQKGELSFKFKPLSKEELLDKKEPRINLSLNVGAKRLSENNVREALEAVENVELRVNSDIDLETQLLYNNNPFVSEGPIPPRVNTPTTYAVRWSIKNTTNKLTNAKVTATLPVYVQYLDIKTPATENLVYNKVENTLTWYVGDVEPKTGYDQDKTKEVTFGISFIPSASQVGKVPDLLLNQTIEAQDTFTNQKLRKDLGNLPATLTEPGALENSGRVEN